MTMKILIAEDEIISCRALEKNLQDWGYEAIATKNGEEAWEIIKKGEIRLAILDWTMPKMDGVELCHKIRNEYQQQKAKYIYIILLTGRDLQEDIITGLSAGADDYMTKPFNSLELKIRIQNGERIISLEDSRLKIAHTDVLTQIWNRRRIVEILEEEMERCYREEKSLGVLILDIDFFKTINDTKGHATGDKVLVELAAQLRRNIRKYDKVGRYGGDEFLIILPGCDEKHAFGVGERLRESVMEMKIETKEGPIRITVSVGIALLDTHFKETAETLIQRSDKALYQTKKGGRNRVMVIGPHEDSKEGQK